MKAQQRLVERQAHFIQWAGRAVGKGLAARLALIALVSGPVAAELAGFHLTGRALHGLLRLSTLYDKLYVSGHAKQCQQAGMATVIL